MCAVFGGELSSCRFRCNRAAALRPIAQEVADAARRATGVRGGGRIENANQRIVITPQSQALSARRWVLRYRGGYRYGWAT